MNLIIFHISKSGHRTPGRRARITELAKGRPGAGSQCPGSQGSNAGSHQSAGANRVLWAIFTYIYWAQMNIFISL